MTLSADLFWSFRSPYSYLATARYAQIARDYDVVINLRPVYPLAIREPDFFEKNNPNWLAYMLRDIFRLAEYMDIPLAPPNPDPVMQDLATRKIADEQPYIFRLTRLGQAAARRSKGLDFVDKASRLIWGGTANWHQGEHLTNAARACGLDFAELESEAASDAEALDADIAANQDALEKSGHWGVPTLVFNDEPFFGQDRIEHALWRMEQAGLKKTETQDK
ncbi:2-hydroxychromene-2-carboxylate isomerase [Parasphingorhabdus sp. DH2-15]|uniref:2-hydroxychromene-2-carboxylate isomerase n=1 Tax=Parasphingorhabdus sp. DH2-15 TaxID=3444112 RepID=UPI003F688DA9